MYSNDFSSTGRRPPRAARRGIGGVLLLIGAALLLTASFVGWYAISEQATYSFPTNTESVSVTLTFLAGNSYQVAISSCPSITTTAYPQCYQLSNTSTYRSSSGGLLPHNSTGALYQNIQIVQLTALALSILAGALAIAAYVGRRRWMLPVALLMLVAVALAFAAPVGEAAYGPSALRADETAGGAAVSANYTGPATSFFGSCQGGACFGQNSSPGVQDSVKWGPAAGWFLSLTAGGLFIAALVLWLSDRRRNRPLVAPVTRIPRGAPPPSVPPAGVDSSGSSPDGAVPNPAAPIDSPAESEWPPPKPPLLKSR